MGACQTDPAMASIAVLSESLMDAFSGDKCPPLVGHADVVRFFAGDGAPLAAWDSHASQGCESPFIWVRAMRRYTSSTFPSPTLNTSPCGAQIRVVAIEAGVGFCAVIDQSPSWEQYSAEAAVSMDTAWRLEIALDNAACKLRYDAGGDRLTAVDSLVPYGPEGGVIAWTGVLYVNY